MRYEIAEETIKDGRKKLKQFCVVDTLTNEVIVRYADAKKAEEVLLRLQTAANHMPQE